MSSYLILQIAFIFLSALVLAGLEIQIEGKNGWAKELPAWRPKPSAWYAKLYSKIFSQKELDGYHLLVISLVFLFFHYPFFAGAQWSWAVEFFTLSLFFIFCSVWDFLWFVMNPHYGIFKFKKGLIPWHKKWIVFLPEDYWSSLFFSAVCYVLGGYILQGQFASNFLLEWIKIILLFVGLTALISLIFSFRVKRP